MTEIIFAFPMRSRAPLCCVWTETGDPARPLVCKWIVGHQSTLNRPSNVDAALQSHRLCA
jgi:hypothetical protein